MGRRLISVFSVSFLGIVFYALSLGTSGCGGGSGANASVSERVCDPIAQSGCDDGLICEEITDGGSNCFKAVVARGSVFNCADESQLIEGARVVAIDVNGSPISTVAVTDSEGHYELTVPARRTPDGTLAGDDFTLRTSSPIEEDETFVIDNSLTDVCLIALDPGFGTASIFGEVDLPEESRGALVVAESSSTSGFSAIADREGNYRIFNLPANTYAVKAYVQGADYDTVSATVADSEEKEVNLSPNDDPTSTLNGSVQIVNPGEGDATSVILVVESTFNEALVRGETPPGLRAPAPGTDPNVTGSFTIEGIPSGRYVVLAAFENDFLVRDPDQCIAGTDILHEEFAAGDTLDLSDGFKITGSLDVISPGADGPETVATATPTFTWVDDSSEQEYLVQVFDSFGNLVGKATIPGVSGDNPSTTYGDAEWTDEAGTGPAAPFESGMFYQLRATSIKDGCELSQTEDLKGVFFVQ